MQVQKPSNTDYQKLSILKREIELVLEKFSLGSEYVLILKADLKNVVSIGKVAESSILNTIADSANKVLNAKRKTK